MQLSCWWYRRSRKCKKQEHILIEHDIMRNIEMVRLNMKAFCIYYEENYTQEKHTSKTETRDCDY
jgi:hypothetical protein